jgi:tetratricopeptide (TPR) repeat protein
MAQYGTPLGGLVDIEPRELRARAHRVAGRPEEAAEVLRELLRIYGGHHIAHYELGQIYEEMEHPKEAETEYAIFLHAWAEADEGVFEVEDARRRLGELREAHGT